MKMEGYINLFETDDKLGNKPHFKGYVKIDGVDHEFALWPSRTGKGFSGKYRPKTTAPKTEANDDAIPF
jgi:hypothetical protein